MLDPFTELVKLLRNQMFTKELDSLDLRCYTTVGMDQFPMLYGGSNLDFTGDHLELPGDHSLSPIHVSASRKKKNYFGCRKSSKRRNSNVGKRSRNCSYLFWCRS